MSLTFSLQKPATYLSLLLIGAAGTLLGTNLLPMKGQLVEQPLAQLHTVIPGSANLRLVADSSTNSPDLPEKLGGAELLLGLAAVAGTAGVIVSARKQNSAPHRSSSNPTSNSTDIIRIDQASRKLQQQLLMLLHDDRDTANRLLSQVRMRNPHKSIDWYVEKVIYDLERDRGSY